MCTPKCCQYNASAEKLQSEAGKSSPSMNLLACLSPTMDFFYNQIPDRSVKGAHQRTVVRPSRAVLVIVQA